MPFALFHSVEDCRRYFSGQSKGSVVTIGNFDGVHLGHQKILQGVVEQAREVGAQSVAITFNPHPLRALRPMEELRMVVTLEQRIELLRAEGLDAVLVACFDAALAAKSPREFVKEFLVDALRARSVHVGQNFRFGHRQAGDAAVLSDLGSEYGFEVKCVDAVVLRGTVVSSTAIRTAVGEGRVERAGRLLGRPFSLCGEVMPGTGTGRRLIVPTLNLSTNNELLPGRGVYVTQTRAGGEWHASATNVGVRPTFDGRSLSMESHLFDFDEELTSGPMEIRFLARLRAEHKFPSAEALREQVLADLARARRFFLLLDRLRAASKRQPA
ncbi:MAG: bifunctional riboflavin kinase/FAD synthetase [Candidatus Acidiferrales bacterium]